MIRRFGLIASLAPPVFTVSAISATLLTPGYSSVKDTFSLLAGPGTPYPLVIQAGFVAYGTLVQGLGPVLYVRAGRGRTGLLLWALIALYSSGGVLAAVFRDAYQSLTLWGITENAAHDFVARVGFAAILLLTVITPWALRRDASLPRWRAFSLAMAVGSIAFVVPFQANVWLGIEGVLQRGFFATTMLWVFLSALTLSQRHEAAV